MAKKRKPRATKQNQATATNKVYSAIVAELLEELEKGNIVWRKTWKFNQYRQFLNNPISKNPFTGRNVFLLAWVMMIRGWENPNFATLKQISKAGGALNEGESKRYVRVVRFSPIKESYADAKARLGHEASDDERNVLFMKPNYYRVYNLKAQTTGLEDYIPADPEALKISEFETIDEAQAIWDNFSDKPPVQDSTQGRASYTPIVDVIHMPPAISFESPAYWYATLFHEGAHSTGNVTRLNRDMGKSFGNNKYAKEELVAEVSAAILCGIAGISGETMQNNAAYINGWHAALKDNPKMLIDAMRDAEQACDWILKLGKFAPKANAEGEAVSA